jgi:curved DNA-binding protein CbpA
MQTQRNYYEILGVPQAATIDEIKNKYRELARKFHPDIVKDKSVGTRIFVQFNQAYSTLRNPDRRTAYDAWLQGPKTEAPKATVDIESLIRSADAALMIGDAEQAILLCRGAIDAGPGTNARAYAIYGDALAQTRQNEPAIEAYRKSLSIARTALVEAKLNTLIGTVSMLAARK